MDAIRAQVDEELGPGAPDAKGVRPYAITWPKHSKHVRGYAARELQKLVRQKLLVPFFGRVARLIDLLVDNSALGESHEVRRCVWSVLGWGEGGEGLCDQSVAQLFKARARPGSNHDRCAAQ